MASARASQRLAEHLVEDRGGRAHLPRRTLLDTVMVVIEAGVILFPLVRVAVQTAVRTDREELAIIFV